MEAINIISIITIAFLGSFGHCIGMCGGIVIAYTSTKIDDRWSKTRETLSHLSYSFGRISTYMILGLVFGFLGGVVTMSSQTNGILLIVAGALMILAGVSLMGGIKFLTLIEHSISKSSWYQSSFKRLLKNNSLYSFFLLGMLNGLLPCGLVYSFAIIAASTADPLWGAFVMGIFGLSTIPALFSLGFFVGLFKAKSIRATMVKLASIAVILYGLSTIYNGYNFLKKPNRTLLECHTNSKE